MLFGLNFKLHERETFEVNQISIHFGFGFRPLRISCFLRIWPSGRLLGFATTYLKGSGKNAINTSSNFLILTMMTGLFFENLFHFYSGSYGGFSTSRVYKWVISPSSGGALKMHFEISFVYFDKQHIPCPYVGYKFVFSWR